VGRPLSARDVPGLMRAHGEGASAREHDAVAVLADARRQALLPLVSTAPPLDLDEPTVRLGAAVHDLLALAHPRIAAGPGSEARIERIAVAAAALAGLGAPATFQQVLARHSVVARLPEVVRMDHTVRYWLGRKTFVGRRPPARMLALPRVRGVKVETVRRAWLRDVGIQVVARPAFLALTEASPLGEALDPLRLDPPPSWGRMLSILRFPAIARLVAGRLVEIGVARAGDALTEALHRFGSLGDAAGPVRASPQAIAFAVQFLAHGVWLDHLFAQATPSTRGPSVPLARRAPRPPPVAKINDAKINDAGVGQARVSEEGAGRELYVLLAAALQVEPELIWPQDIPRGSETGQRFASHLERLFNRHEVTRSPRWPAALELARLSAGAARRQQAGDAV
jgi:hypothetical protein